MPHNPWGYGAWGDGSWGEFSEGTSVSNTLLDVRRMIGLEVGDLTLIYPTAEGTINTLIDQNNLWVPDRRLEGCVLYFTQWDDADDAYRKAVVTANTQNSTSLTFNPSLELPVTPADEGDGIELWRKRGQGYDPVNEVNQFIRAAIRKANNHAWFEDSYDVTADFDRDTPYFAIPSGTRGVFRVEYEDRGKANYWYNIPRSRNSGGSGWTIERDSEGGPVIRIDGDWVGTVDQANIRIHRVLNYTVPVEDTDTVDCPLDWVLLEVKARLYENAMDSNPKDGTMYSRWQLAEQNADRRLGMLGDRVRPDTFMLSPQ